MKRIILLSTVCLFISFWLLFASDPGTGDWPMWGGTPDRNMVSLRSLQTLLFDPLSLCFLLAKSSPSPSVHVALQVDHPLEPAPAKQASRSPRSPAVAAVDDDRIL